MMQQSTFDLAFPTSYHAHDFVVTDSNALAHKTITEWQPTPDSNGLLLTGPTASGKTHLAHMWAEMHHARFVSNDLLGEQPSHAWFEQHTAVVLEDIETCDAEPLFHFLQHLKQHHDISVLLTSQTPLQALWVTPPDIHSRLKSCLHAALNEPDDELLQALLIKGFSDRQLRVEPAVLTYILARTERSCVAIYQLLQALDEIALREKRPITLPLVRRVLDK